MNNIIKLNAQNCQNCFKCIRECPVKSIKFADHQANIIKDECILCGACFVACPQNAKQVRNDVPTAKGLIRAAQLAGGKPVVLNLPPIDSGRYFRWISRNLSPSRILRFLKEVGFIGRWQEMFNIAAVQVASAAGVPVIDIRSAFLAQPDFRSYLCADGIHPNEAGQKLIYGAIRRQLPSAT